MEQTTNYQLSQWKAALALPGAEEARRFRGSGTIGGPDRAGNRNAATVCD